VIPASHLLTGYLLGTAIRLKSPAPAPKRFWLDPTIIMAVGATMVPDLDVLPGLVSAPGSDWHRGFTHSLPGIVVQAILLTAIARVAWQFVFGEVLSSTPLFTASMAGFGSHVFWDFLNPWGVRLFEPFSEQDFGANLMHEGDHLVLGILVTGAVLCATRRYRLGFLTPVLLLAAYAILQLQWRSTIEQQAREELPAELIRLYPNAQVDCPWLVLARFADHFEAHCVSVPLSGDRRLTAEKPRIDPPKVTATYSIALVEKYRSERSFAFAEIHTKPDGSATVVWRDLRVAVFETDSAKVSGCYVYLSAEGQIVGYELKWFLRWWFW